MTKKKLYEIAESQGGLILLLAALLCFFSLLSIYVAGFFPGNEKLYLLFSNLVTGVSSSLFTLARVTGRMTQNTPPDSEPAEEKKPEEAK